MKPEVTRHSSLLSILAACCFILLLSSFNLRAQSYSIDWFKIAGGGGTSTGSVYSVSGSIGQAEAGATMTGGNYTLTGGFWSLLTVVQTPGAPKLTIAATTTNTLVIAWPSPSTGFTLQTNFDLGTTNWGDVPAFFDSGTNRFVVVNPAIGNRFYRLFKP